MMYPASNSDPLIASAGDDVDGDITTAPSALAVTTAKTRATPRMLPHLITAHPAHLIMLGSTLAGNETEEASRAEPQEDLGQIRVIRWIAPSLEDQHVLEGLHPGFARARLVMVEARIREEEHAVSGHADLLREVDVVEVRGKLLREAADLDEDRPGNRDA